MLLSFYHFGATGGWLLRSALITQPIVKFSLVIFLLFFSFLQSAVASQESTLPKASYISPQTTKEWLDKGKDILFIDVRKPEEYKKGHIEKAMSLPYDQVEKHLDKFEKDQTIIFYCISSSWRAPYAANLLKDHGFQNIYILEGGITAWKGGGQTIRGSRFYLRPEIAPYPRNLKIALRHPADRTYKEKTTLTHDELKLFDGKEGRPAYVAVNGKIYDVTQSRLWRGGAHDPSHGKASAGYDLTFLIKESPHGAKELKKFPVVGRLVEDYQ